MRLALAFTVLLAAGPLLAGCADRSGPALRARLDPLVGISEADLLRRLGTPTRQAGGALVYHQYWPDFAFGFRPVGAAPPAIAGLEDRFCEVSFALRAGRVAGYALRGDACGWGDFPAVAPA